MTETTVNSAMRLRALAAGLQDSNISVLHQTLDMAYDLVENLHPVWPARDLLGHTDLDSLDDDLGPRLEKAKSLCLRTGENNNIEVELGDESGRTVFEVNISPDRDASGIVFGLFTVLRDVTEQRARERAMDNLLREVSHRSKNLLAIVQSVAMQTAQHSGSIDDFLLKFRGRLHALSSSQDLVTESNWRGTYLRPLITAQLARVGQVDIDAIQVVGDDPLLGPNAALHVGLAIHELATNAVIHGALAQTPPGRISISATYVEDGLVFEWHESKLPAGSVSPNVKFGGLVLQRIVPLSLGGSALLEIQDDRVYYRLTIPATQYHA